MANHSLPTTTSTYANYTSELDGRLDDLAVGLDPAVTTATNVPTNSIRWSSAAGKWQKWNGSAWGDLASSYSININGTVGATTPASGAFTTLSTSGAAALASASVTGALTAGSATLNGTSIPASVTLVSTDATQTLTAKTLTTPVLSGTASGTTAGRLGYLSGALSYGNGTVQRTVVNTDESQTLTNKTIAFGSNTLTDVASTNTTQTLTNKTISGGIYSGVADFTGSQRASIVAVSALDIDCSAGNYFTKTISANSTFTFSNAPASRAYSFTLELTHTSGTVTWPTAVRWPGGTAPTLTTGKTHVFVFVTDDSGTLWRGASLVDYAST